MTGADFGRGDGDPLGGPTVARMQDDPDISSATVQFRVADSVYGVRSVYMTWTDPEGEAEAALRTLWRLWYADVLARARIAGTGDLLLG